jgi:CheY-like chemotaxis protein
MRYRIALCGFSEFEYRAMHFSFQHLASPEATEYHVVDALAEADFAVVDADSKPAVKGVVLSNRITHAVFVGAVAPPGVNLHLTRPIDPTRIRRLLDTLAERFPEGRVRLEPPADLQLPTLDDVVSTLGAFEPPTGAPAPAAVPVVAPAAVPVVAAPAPPPVAAAPTAPPVDDTQADPEYSVAKKKARAAARRARLASSNAEAHAAEPLRDVMVLDADERAGGELCTLLERFGFSPQWLRSIPKAAEHLAAKPFAAYFLDIALDGADRGEGLSLVQRIQELPVRDGHPAPAVLIVSAQINPADRVRAALAGIKVPLVKPVSRGDVARALEGCGVSLPSDARRSG